ncbi:hypothetical protein CBR_g79690, partial [Chara braunii]
AFGIVAAIGISAAAVAISLTIVLFRIIGPKQTRFVAQIMAAVIGAGFVIGLQVAAILSTGTLSRFSVLTSDAALSIAPEMDSPVWWPVKALLGDGTALLSLLAGSLILLGVTIAVFAPRLGDDVIKASAAAVPAGPRADAGRRFHTMSRQQALRWKELLLLRRDPWLVSQTLMQLLYLLPPALMLWRSFADSSVAIVLITPVIVMAAGQLAGGLAWLTISGEDAADLVATAPLPGRQVTRAKIEVVLIVIGAVCAPLVIPLAFVAPVQAAVTAVGVMISAMSATAIQLWFRVQARRSQFRRRQTSSRLATFAEAFASIGWAATSGLALAIGNRRGDGVGDAGIVQGVASGLDDTQFGLGPHRGQCMRRRWRAQQVVASLHNDAANAAQLAGLRQQLPGGEEAMVLEVVRLHERRRGQRARAGSDRIEIEPGAAGLVFRQDAFGVVPGTGRGRMHGGIGIEDAAPVGVERLCALFSRQQAQEVVVEGGIERPQPAEESPFEFGAGAEKCVNRMLKFWDQPGGLIAVDGEDGLRGGAEPAAIRGEAVDADRFAPSRVIVSAVARCVGRLHHDPRVHGEDAAPADGAGREHPDHGLGVFGGGGEQPGTRSIGNLPVATTFTQEIARRRYTDRGQNQQQYQDQKASHGPGGAVLPS